MQKKYIFEIQSVNNHLILDFGFQKAPLFHRHHQQSKISFLCLQTKLIIYHYFNSLLLMHSSRIASNTKFEPKYFPQKCEYSLLGLWQQYSLCAHQVGGVFCASLLQLHHISWWCSLYFNLCVCVSQWVISHLSNNMRYLRSIESRLYP